jgi:hypothetical protein
LSVRPYAGPGDAPPQSPLDWPLAGSLATAGTPLAPDSPELGRCLVVGGADLDRLWPALGRANALTPFVSQGQRYALVVRPLLPDEPAACD